MRCVLLVLTVVLAQLPALEARADDVGVTRVELLQESGDTSVLLVRAPAALARSLAVPRLRDGTPFESEGFVATRDGGGALRYRLSGRSLGATDVLHFPWNRQGVLLVARRADGALVQRLFVRTGVGIDTPLTTLWPSSTTLWERAHETVLGGMSHFLTGFLHLAFLVVFWLLALGRRGLRWAGAFLGGQVLVVVALSLARASLPAPTGELALALATAFLGAAAFGRPVGPAFSWLLFFAGLFHASGLAGSLPMRVGAVLGMDAVLLAGVAVTAVVIPSPRRVRRLRTALAAVLGAVSLALILLWLWESPRAVLLDKTLVEAGSGPLPPLPGGPGESTGTVAMAPGTVPARPLPTAPLQTFLVIEPYEVRHEILARLQDLSPWIEGLADRSAIPIAEQPDLRARLGAFFEMHEAMTIDGRRVQPALRRVDFVTVGPKGTLPREDPVPESMQSAYVGIVFVFATGPMVREVSLEWRLFEPASTGIPAAITDPEQTRRLHLTLSQPRLMWTNELAFDPVPRIEPIRVEAVALPVPMAALPFFLLAVLLLWRFVRDRRRTWLFAGARVALVLGLLVAPIGEVALALPFVEAPSPSQAQAQTIVGGLLTNVYRAFVFRDEESIYDRLSVSVTGDRLAEIYLEHRRALELAERGGARARVEAVDIESVHGVEAIPGGFAAEYTWTVAGSVSHFGHRHYRQNRYVARVVVKAVGEAWKIVGIEVLDEARVL